MTDEPTIPDTNSKRSGEAVAERRQLELVPMTRAEREQQLRTTAAGVTNLLAAKRRQRDQLNAEIRDMVDEERRLGAMVRMIDKANR